MKAVAFVVVALVCAAVLADDPSGTTGSCEWKISGGTLTVSKPSAATEDCEMDYSSGYKIYDVKKIVVEAGVKLIYDNSFSGFENLTEVTVSAPSIEVGDGAFQNNGKLTSVTFKTVSSLGSYVFEGCYEFKTLTFQCDNCTIASNAFGSSNLDTLIIKGNIWHLSNYAFNSGNLRRLVVPVISEIETNAFAGIDELVLLYYTGPKNPCKDDQVAVGGDTPIIDVVVPTSYNSTNFCDRVAKHVSLTTSSAVSNVVVRALLALTMLVAVLLA